MGGVWNAKEGSLGPLYYYKGRSIPEKKRTHKLNTGLKKEKEISRVKLQDGSKMYTIHYGNRSFNVIPKYVDLGDPTIRFTRDSAGSALVVNHNICNNYYLNCHTDDARGMFIASNNIDAMTDEWALGSNLTYKQAMEIRDAIYGV